MLKNGKTVFSAGRDKCVRLWDLESRRQIGLLPHQEEVVGAAASPNGRWLATASSKHGEGQPVLLWDLAARDLATQKAVPLTDKFWLRPGSINFSADSNWLAFGTMLRSGLRIWDVNKCEPFAHLPDYSDGSGWRLGLAFSPVSPTLAYNDDKGAIVLRDIASQSEIGRLTGHEGAVTAIAFSLDGKMLASRGKDRSTRLWNVADRGEKFRFPPNSGGVSDFAFSPDLRTLAMGGGGATGRVIRIADIETGNVETRLRGHLGDISGLAFTPGGEWLLSASDDGTLRVWDPVTAAKEKSVHVFDRNSISNEWLSFGPALCLSPDGRHLLTVYRDQKWSVWDTLQLTEGKRHALPFPNTENESTLIAAVAPGGKRCAFASRKVEVMLGDAESGKARFFAQPGTYKIHRLVFSPDGRSLAAADDEWTRAQTSVPDDTKRTIRVWDVETRKETHVIPSDGEFPVSLTFSADAKALLAGFAKGPVKLWPLDGQGEAARFSGHSGWVRGAGWARRPWG